MNIRIATTDSEIVACYPVMRELRPHIEEVQFLAKVRSQENSGYRLAFLHQPEGVVAVAGFRLGENLAWGRFLYIDDLVTLSTHRSKGFGSNLLSWLREFAVKEGCVQIHLDSGIQRKDAHRFYERECMSMASFHFVLNMAPNNTFNRTTEAMSMVETKSGLNFTAVNLGPLAQLNQYTFKHPALPRETEGKVFLNQLLG